MIDGRLCEIGFRSLDVNRGRQYPADRDIPQAPNDIFRREPIFGLLHRGDVKYRCKPFLPRLKLVSRAQVLRCKSGWSHGGPWEGLGLQPSMVVPQTRMKQNYSRCFEGLITI